MMRVRAKRGKGRWTKEEHKNFLKGVELHGKDWKAISDHVLSRTVVQIRTHAQKYFQKADKGICFPEEPYLSSGEEGVTDSSGSSDCECSSSAAASNINNRHDQQPCLMHNPNNSRKKNPKGDTSLRAPQGTGNDITSARLATLIPSNGVRGKRLIRPDPFDQSDCEAETEPVRPLLRTTRGRTARGRAAAVAAQAKATAARHLAMEEAKRRKLNIDAIALLANDSKCPSYAESMALSASHSAVFSYPGAAEPDADMGSPKSTLSGANIGERDDGGGVGFGFPLADACAFRGEPVISTLSGGNSSTAEPPFIGVSEILNGLVPPHNIGVGYRGNDVRSRSSPTLNFSEYEPQYPHEPVQHQHQHQYQDQHQQRSASEGCRHSVGGAGGGAWDAAAPGVIGELESFVRTPSGGSTPPHNYRSPFNCEFFETLLMDGNDDTENTDLHNNANNSSNAGTNNSQFEAPSAKEDHTTSYAAPTATKPSPIPNGVLTLPTGTSRAGTTNSNPSTLALGGDNPGPIPSPSFFQTNSVSPSNDIPPLPLPPTMTSGAETVFGQRSTLGCRGGGASYASAWPVIGRGGGAGGSVGQGLRTRGVSCAGGAGGSGCGTDSVQDYSSSSNSTSSGDNRGKSDSDIDLEALPPSKGFFAPPRVNGIGATNGLGMVGGLVLGNTAGASPREMDVARAQMTQQLGSMSPVEVNNASYNDVNDHGSVLGNEAFDSAYDGEVDLLFLCEDTFSML